MNNMALSGYRKKAMYAKAEQESSRKEEEEQKDAQYQTTDPYTFVSDLTT